jgi:ubiquinone/menaquinone biosynthesis C-methylase UbiE
MITSVKMTALAAVKKLMQPFDPVYSFHSNHYLRHNTRKLEHLASLRIPVTGMTVLEVGAGIGDHSEYYLDRGCQITITEARPENLHYLQRRYPDQAVQFLDMERPSPLSNAPFDLIHCYGLLYHLSNPEPALEFLSRNCKYMLLLETCVSFGSEKAINPVQEKRGDFTQAVSGTGCRPTRPWLFEKLQSLFEYVYLPTTQPNHDEFPIDWTAPEKHQASFSRAIFIASRQPINNELLTVSLVDQQARHP